MSSVYSLELIMMSKTADQLRHHYYSDLRKLSLANPVRINEILRCGKGRAESYVRRAREYIEKNEGLE
jgi:hypothetical protein